MRPVRFTLREERDAAVPRDVSTPRPIESVPRRPIPAPGSHHPPHRAGGHLGRVIDACKAKVKPGSTSAAPAGPCRRRPVGPSIRLSRRSGRPAGVACTVALRLHLSLCLPLSFVLWSQGPFRTARSPVNIFTPGDPVGGSVAGVDGAGVQT